MFVKDHRFIIHSDSFSSLILGGWPNPSFIARVERGPRSVLTHPPARPRGAKTPHFPISRAFREQERRLGLPSPLSLTADRS